MIHVSLPYLVLDGFLVAGSIEQVAHNPPLFNYLFCNKQFLAVVKTQKFHTERRKREMLKILIQIALSIGNASLQLQFFKALST